MEINNITEAQRKPARKRSGGERGSAKDRRRRRQWILGHFGDGERARCIHCPTIVDWGTMEIDRTEIGGKYVRQNVQPSCKPCNRERGDHREWVGRMPIPHPDRPCYGPGAYEPHDPTTKPTLAPMALAA
jgi:hypothetical protein